MKKLKSYLYIATSSVILLITLTFINIGQAVAQPPAKDVNVTNTPLLVRDVNAPTNQPFQAEVSFNIPAGSTSTTFTLANVSTGKRLVIEHVSIIGEVPSGQKMGARISTTAGGQFVAHHLVLTEQGPLWGVPTFAASQPMRVYADPSTVVLGIVYRSDTTYTSDGLMSISGHLVDIP